MTIDGVERGHFLRELGDIRSKISGLADSLKDSDKMRNEVAILGLRLGQLMKELTGGDGVRGGGPESRVVLVVDDNDELRTFIRHALELADYNVLDASGGEEALELLQNMTTLDMVLCDVILPGKRGPALVNEIRALFPEVKVAFMSGYITEDIVSQDVEQIVASGGIFLQKPFPTRQLLEAVHDTLGV